jgi:hypothetical protein
LAHPGQIPLGSIVDARHGTVRICTASDSQGRQQCGHFHGGKFTLLQTNFSRPITELVLVGGSFGSCATQGRATAAARARPRRGVWGNAKGRFRIRGRYASGIVRGTIWWVGDYCAGTRVIVRRGLVTVRDLRRRKRYVVRQGHSRFINGPGA